MSTQLDIPLNVSDQRRVSWRFAVAMLLCYLTIAAVSAFVRPEMILVGILSFAIMLAVVSLRTGIVIFLIVAVPIEGVVGGGLYYNSVHYPLLYFCIAVVLARLYFRGERAITPPRQILIPLFVFSAWVVFRSAFAINTLTGLKEIVEYIGILAVFLVGYQLIDSRKAFRNTLIWQIVFAFIYVIIAVIAHSGEVGGRLSVLGSRPNAVGFYAYMWSSISILGYCYFRSRMAKSFAIALFAGCAYILMLTGSRASILALFAFLVSILMLRGHWRIVVAGGAAGVFAAALVVASGVLSQFLDRLSLFLRLSSGMTMRSEFWLSAVKLISDYPLFGVGGGCVKEVFWQYVRLTDPRIIAYAHGAVQEGIIHNGVLSNTAQYGLVGLALVLWVNYIALRQVATVRNRFDRGCDLRLLADFIIATIIAVTAHGMFENSMTYGVVLEPAIIAVVVAGAFRIIVDGDNSAKEGVFASEKPG